MAIGEFIKKVLGGGRAITIPDAPFARTGPRADAPAPVATVRAAPAGASPFSVRRDEMLDARSRIAGYRFSTSGLGGQARPNPRAGIAALGADNLASFAARRLALVPITAQDWFEADFGALHAPHTTYLVLSPPDGAGHAHWLRALAEIKASGARLALDGAAARAPQALALADLLLLDFGTDSPLDFEPLVRHLGATHPDLALAADNVGSWAEHRLCLSMGMRYCLGGFSASTDTGDWPRPAAQTGWHDAPRAG